MSERRLSDAADAEKPRILLVEDSPALSRLYSDYLRGARMEVVHAATGKAALKVLEEAPPPPVVLLDLMLPDMNGLAILKHIKRRGLATAVLVITAHGNIDIAVRAMQAGAYDFLAKPFNLERLMVTLRNALERHHLSQLVETLSRDLGRDRFYDFIGASLPMQAVYRIIESAGPSKATVFITGESGTGKELCARAIHACSPRRGRPFVALNCSALPKELMESQIFGHLQGAFTGAVSAREGAARKADGGTLFLDEICELDPGLQGKLLRFVQTGMVQPLGSDTARKVDVRLLCATNRDPWREVEAGRFREDLYYRLHVIPLPLPPLRNRRADILPIARHFLQVFAKEEGKAFSDFDGESQTLLAAHTWPGNVRELQNVVRNIVVLHEGPMVRNAMLPPLLREAMRTPLIDAAFAEPSEDLADNDTPQALPKGALKAARTEKGEGAVQPLWMAEKQIIEAAIERCGGNVRRAARLLQIDPSTIYRKRALWREHLSGSEPAHPPAEALSAAAAGGDHPANT
jgi:DNA-binding NtrC family response regulator